MRTAAHHRLRAIVFLALAITLSAFGSPELTRSGPTLATPTRLSAITATNGTVAQLKVAGDYVVYLADYASSGRFDLYSVPVAGGQPTLLTGNLATRPRSDFEITANGLVVFTTFEGSFWSGWPFLYSVPLTGGEPTYLGPIYPNPRPEPSGYKDLPFAISPDGARVVYLIDAARENLPELFSVPTAGGTTVRLSPPSPDPLPDTFWGVNSFQVSRDGQWAVFTHYDSTTASRTLRVAPVSGGTESTILMDGDINSYTIAPDSSRVAYGRADGPSYRVNTLYSVPLSGGAPANLGVEGSDLTFAFTPDSQRIIYHRSEASSTSATLGSVVAAGGSSPVPIATSETGFGDGYGYKRFVVAPDGQSIFYTLPATTGLFRRPVLGGLETIAHDSTSVALSSLTFSADSQYVLFKGSSPPNYYSYPLAGGQSVLIADNASNPLLLMPTGHGVIYSRLTASPFGGATGDTGVLYATSAAGGPPVALAENLGPGEERLYALGGSSGGVVFFASGSNDANPLRLNHIYAMPFDGSAAPRLVDQPDAIVGNVSDFAISPIDGRAVYIADQDTDEVPELFSVPLTGGPSVQLSRPGERVFTFSISPVGGHVFYAAYISADNNQQILASVPISGGDPASIGDPGQYSLGTHAFTPDGAQIVFDTSNGWTSLGLYRAPATGGPAVLIDLEGGGFSISPDSTQVVYTAPYNVLSAPLNTGSPLPPVTLGRGMTPAISPNGDMVLFERRGENFFEPGELVAVPIAGGEPVVLVPGIDRYDLGGFTPNGARAIVTTYKRTGAGEDAILTLRSVLLSGAGSVTLAEVQGPLYSRFGSSIQARLTPDGGRVVYRARLPEAGGVTPVHLASIPTTGGESTPLATHAGTTTNDAAPDLPFALSPNSAQVLVQRGGSLLRGAVVGGDLEQLSAGGAIGQFAFTDDSSTLFVEDGRILYAPAGAAPARIDGLPAGVSALRFARTGQVVVFTAVSEGSGTTELYAANITVAPPPPPGSQIFLPLLRR